MKRRDQGKEVEGKRDKDDLIDRTANRRILEVYRTHTFISSLALL